jgi:hypothetical protein
MLSSSSRTSAWWLRKSRKVLSSTHSGRTNSGAVLPFPPASSVGAAGALGQDGRHALQVGGRRGRHFQSDQAQTVPALADQRAQIRLIGGQGGLEFVELVEQDPDARDVAGVGGQHRGGQAFEQRVGFLVGRHRFSFSLPRPAWKRARPSNRPIKAAARPGGAISSGGLRGKQSVPPEHSPAGIETAGELLKNIRGGGEGRSGTEDSVLFCPPRLAPVRGRMIT